MECCRGAKDKAESGKNTLRLPDFHLEGMKTLSSKRGNKCASFPYFTDIRGIFVALSSVSLLGGSSFFPIGKSFPMDGVAISVAETWVS